MCGIAAYSGKSINILKAMHLLNDNDERGGHSTGIYVENGTFKKLYKTTGKSRNLLKTIDHTYAELFIGHTRYATHGEKTAENTHPYMIGNYIGCHNGVLNNYEDLAKKYKFKVPDVDSKAIYKALEAAGTETLGEHGGTINAVWTERDGKLYVYRRNNPLYILETEDGVYFSSLEEGLESICPDECKVVEVEPEILFIYENGKLIDSVAIETTYKPEPYKVVKNWTDYRNVDKGGKNYNGDYDAQWFNSYNTTYNKAYKGKGTLLYEETPDFGLEIYPDKDCQPKELSDVMHSIELLTSIIEENYEFFSDRDIDTLNTMLAELARSCDELEDWLAADNSQEELPF
tara:strand:- start:1180 stop:2217 length:1038 start_codon:yes stop_codon:yes gene_type:complete